MTIFRAFNPIEEPLMENDLLEHEPKEKHLTYDFNDIDFDGATLNIVLEANDGVGNKQQFSATVYRKPKR